MRHRFYNDFSSFRSWCGIANAHRLQLAKTRNVRAAFELVIIRDPADFDDTVMIGNGPDYEPLGILASRWPVTLARKETA
jgi:hypothetical protein